MKDPLQRTKVVIRHLPPSLSQSDLFSLIDERFSDCYNWFCFRPGKSCHKNHRYSRAYIEFKMPDYVFEFAEFFDGHIFVNEKGTQFKTIVEYASSQRVPKQFTKKDGREGTIYKDPDYLEFLKLIAKPVENLPSAEIQLERKEAEQSGVAKENYIVTPLMDYIRQKRAAESGTQGSVTVGKGSRRARVTSTGKPGKSSMKPSSEKKKYILKESKKNMSRKAKAAYLLMPRQADQPMASSGKEMSKNETVSGIDSSLSGITLTTDSGKKKFLLLKVKEPETPMSQSMMSKQDGETSSVGKAPVSIAPRQNHRREASERLIRSILLTNEVHQSQYSTAVRSQKQIQLDLENGKRSPCVVKSQSGSKDHVSDNEPSALNADGDMKRAADDKFTKKDLHSLGPGVKQEKRTRNRDRPDRVVWTPLHRSDVLQTGEQIQSSLASQPTQLLPDIVEVTQGKMKGGMPSSGRQIGSRKHIGNRVAAQNVKTDSLVMASEGKSSKRGGTASSSLHEKQMWVQKSTLGS